jgi:DNA mismatch repair protein MutS2
MKYFNRLHDYQNIVEQIEAHLDESGQIKDNASEELYRVRLQKRKVKNRIHEKLSSLLTMRSNLFTEGYILQRNERYVVPVKRNFKKDIQGIVHSYSNSGETVFVEPIEITEDSAQLVELDEREKEEIEKILTKLTAVVREHGDEIEQDIETIIDLDFLLAKVRFADEFNATMPMFSDNLKIDNGYHPILRRVNEHVVPLNLRMERDKMILLISGPNAGGKTVVLKTVGLLVLMARCGLFIPVDEGSTIPFFEEVYADIGDEQSIESRLSTFAGHIKQIKEALEAKTQPLVLLDELMSQTSVEEGSALAIAILEEFARKKSTVLATTHNEDLKIFVSRRDDMMNGGMEFTDSPTYRLIVGIPQPSNAIKLARNLGINGNVIESALHHLDTEKMSLNELFEDLSKELKAVQEERQRLSLLTSDYESKLEALNTKKKKELNELKARYKKELIQAKRSIEKMVKDFKRESPKPEAVSQMRHFFKEKLQEEEDYGPYYPHVGEMVRIRQLNKVGQVIAEHLGKYKISLENIYYWVGPKEIESAELPD